MPDTKPTRSELIALTKKVKLAKSGHKLLKRKRDGLIQELFKIMEKARKQKTRLNERYSDAQDSMDRARAIEGTSFMKSVSFAVFQKPSLEVRTKRVMGIPVPNIDFEAEKFRKKFSERGYGIIGTTSTVDKAAEAYENLVAEIIHVAEIETTMRKMLVEIDKTKRRVNALEFNVVPRMEREAAFIKGVLEEMAREDTFRLKRFKSKSEAKEG